MLAAILLMLAAVFSLILLIITLLLLNLYAKSFLSQSLPTNPSSSPSTVSVPLFLGSRIHHFHNHTTSTRPRHFHSTPVSNSNSPIKGVESSILSSIPLFTYKSKDKSPVECVVCLGAFEDGEVGRKLPNCGHQFHVECVDMWLYSHSTCPICREEVICEEGKIDAVYSRELGVSAMEIRVEIPNSENESVVLNDLPLDSDSSSSSSSSSSLAFQLREWRARTELSYD